MAMTCRTCDHPQANEINLLLANGGKMAAIAEKYGMAVSSVHRHAQHLPKQVKTAVTKVKNTELRKVGEVWNARLNETYTKAIVRDEAQPEEPRWMGHSLKAIELGLRATGQLASGAAQNVQINVGCLVMPLDQAEAGEDDGEVVDVEYEDGEVATGDGD